MRLIDTDRRRGFSPDPGHEMKFRSQIGPEGLPTNRNVGWMEPKAAAGDIPLLFCVTLFPGTRCARTRAKSLLGPIYADGENHAI